MPLGKHCTVKPGVILGLPTNFSQVWSWLVIPSLNSDLWFDCRRAVLSVGASVLLGQEHDTVLQQILQTPRRLLFSATHLAMPQ